MISGIPISKELLKQLRQKLTIGNLRSIQLNCVPGRSQSKLDISDLRFINESLPDDFLEKLLKHERRFSYPVSFNNMSLNFGSDEEDEQKKLGLLSKRLNRLNTYNKEDYQEYGYESFGFGFPIVVFRPQEDPDKLIRAPLFIWHLSIKKNLSKTNTWNISRKLDQEIEFNNLLRSYLGELSDINIEGFTEKELKDGVLSLDELIQNAIKFVKRFTSFSEKEMSNKLREKFKNGIEPIPSNDVLKKIANSDPKLYWSGVFGRYHLRNEAIRKEMREDMFELLSEYPDDNKEYKEPNINSLMHSETAALTDPSQLGILNYLKENEHLIIQGPPGTGKSESITGIIINALEHGNTCLVVCEKKTAMEVLKDNLRKIYPEIAKLAAIIEDLSTDRKSVVNSVRDRYDRYGHKNFELPTSSNLTEKLELIEDKIRDIHRRKEFLNEADIIEKDTKTGWTQAVGKQLKAKYANGQASTINILEQKKLDIQNLTYSNSRNFLRDFEKKTSKINFKNTLYFIPDSKLKSNDALEFRNELSSILTTNSEELDQFIENFENHLKDRNQQLKAEIQSSIDNIELLHQQLEEIHEKVRNQKLFKKNNFWFKIIKLFEGVSHGLKHQIDLFLETPDVTKNINRELNKFRKDYKLDNELSITAIEKNLNYLTNTLDDLNSNVSSIQKELFNQLIDQPFCEINLNQELCSQFEFWREQSREFLNEYSNKHETKDLFESLSQLKYYVRASKNFSYAMEDGFFNHFEWQKELKNKPITLQKIVSVFTQYDVKNWETQFDEYFINKKLENNYNELTGSYESQLDGLKEERDRLTAEIKDRIPKYWRAKQSEINHDINIPQLYNKRGAKGERRNSLRKIAYRSFESLTAYFPVMMVSPSVCASMFKLEPNLFDYVIFDEASQLKTEESLSTLVRGKRKVISGDKNQMPPSYWFTKVVDGLEVEDQEEYDPYQSFNEELKSTEGALDLANSESLLEFAEICDFKSYYLDFHYRSHHPLLIAFSNAAFYKGRLNPLPKRINQSPIQFIPVNGISENQKNKQEANFAVDILKNIKRDENKKLPTVGIATLNRKQKNLIWDILKREIQIDQGFNKKFSEYEENGLFVKNLENIQGDERDIIILSTTFGPNQNGDFSRRYGPLNRKGLGRRLLNVIVTRAKKKIFVLTSVPNDIYMNYRQELGDGKDKERGYFHAYLAYARAVSEKNIDEVKSIQSFLRDTNKVSVENMGLTESPFEEAVYQALLHKVEQDRIVPQHKTGGFRIDIAVKSKKTGREFIAIECDGATYHKSAEDHAWDIYRQGILEKHGFIFHRIWSRDWWENSERELKKVVNFIEQQDEEDLGHELFDDPVADDIDFTPILENIEPQVDTDAKDDEKDVEVSDNITNKMNLSDTLNKQENQQFKLNYKADNYQEVKVGQIVKLKYLKKGKEVKVKISNNTNAYKEENGVRILKVSSPIGKAILGERVGETVEVGGIEKYCKILEIE